MNESDTTKKDCRLQDENEIQLYSIIGMEIFQVQYQYLETRYDDQRYYSSDTSRETIHLGYFSTIEKAFEFVKNRVNQNYGMYWNYEISLIELDPVKPYLSWKEIQIKEEFDRMNPIVKAGDTDG